MLSELPEGWTLNPLAKILQPSLFIDGDWVESKDQSPDGDVRLVQLADIGDGHFIDKSDRHLTKDAAVRLKCTFLKKGDLLVARMPEPLGRCCVFPLDGEERFVTVVDVAVMRPHDNFNSIWLMNLVNSGYARKFIEDNAGGTTRKRISRKNLGGLPLPVPPLNEQNRIAEILSSADASIQATQAVIEQAERVKRGLMEELLTGGLGSEAIERGEVPEGWITKTLTEIAKVATGKHDANHATEGGRYRFYTCAADFFACDTKRFSGGCIILPGNGANVGEVYYFDGEFDAYQRTYVVSEIDANKRFLLHHLKKYWRERNVNKQYGSATNFLKMGNFKTYKVCLPPQSEQEIIAEILSSIDEFVASQKSVAEQQNRTKRGLMDDLLTGKVRTV